MYILGNMKINKDYTDDIHGIQEDDDITREMYFYELADDEKPTQEEQKPLNFLNCSSLNPKNKKED